MYVRVFPIALAVKVGDKDDVRVAIVDSAAVCAVHLGYCFVCVADTQDGRHSFRTGPQHSGGC